MKRFAFIWITVCILNAAPGLCPAAEDVSGGKSKEGSLVDESGFLTGYGRGSVAEGSYETMFLIWHVGTDAKRLIPGLSSHRGTLSFFLEPQVNPVLSPAGDVEFGLGVGIQYAYPLTDRIRPYILGVVGPHYLNFRTETQARGFIFSTAAGIGSYVHLTKSMALNLGYRIRHMSNAYTRSPNYGIDSHFAVVGFSFFY